MGGCVGVGGGGGGGGSFKLRVCFLLWDIQVTAHEADNGLTKKLANGGGEQKRASSPSHPSPSPFRSALPG